MATLARILGCFCIFLAVVMVFVAVYLIGLADGSPFADESRGGVALIVGGVVVYATVVSAIGAGVYLLGDISERRRI